MVIRIKSLLWTAGILSILILSGIGLWFYLRPMDENQIRNRFSQLSNLVSKSGKEGALHAVGRAKDIAALFSDRSSFEVDGPGWMAGPFSREALSSQLFRSRSRFSRLQLSLDDLNLEIDSGNRTAKVFLSAVLSGTLKDGKTIREIRELESWLRKTEDGWIFESFKVREIIKK